MNSRTPLLSLSLVVVLVFGLGLAGGVALDRQVLTTVAPVPGIPTNAQKNFNLMGEAWNTIQRVYVDRSAVDPTKLTYGSISGMVNALGDTGHSTFLSPQMVQEEQRFTQGEFEGIGAEVEMKNGNVTIVAPFDGSPAQKAGLKPGDIIIKVNGKDVTGLSLEETVSQILGPAGTKVTITIQDPKTGDTRDVTITRAKIIIRNVTWAMLPGTNIADVRLAGFSNNVSKDLQAALTQAQQQGAKGIILDLRNNPGGLLDEAVGVTSQFLKSGDALLEKNAQGQTQAVPVHPGGVATNIPMVVLINNGTASAAEIVSGAVQDAHRAKLVGETTFGTGTVLEEFPLSDGSALMLATQEWLTPAGRVIWHHGITPDIAVPLSNSVNPVVPEGMAGMTMDQLRSSGDTQLLKGLDLLTGSSSNGSTTLQ